MNDPVAAPPLEPVPTADQRLAGLLEQCLVEMEQGRAPDVERLTVDQPELAEPLRTYLSSLDFLNRAASGFAAFSSAGNSAAAGAGKQLGDYRIRREVGRGGMGVVYEAVQVSLDRRVALKVLPLASLLDQKQIARFQKEARAAAHLHHPHIVPIFSVGCERGVHYYAMQYVDGQPLDVAIRQAREERTTGTAIQASTGQRPLEGEDHRASTAPFVSTERGRRSRDCFRTAARLGVQAAEALHHAHQYGIIHRDVKPSNLLLDDRGELWITDFGLARFQAENDRTATGDVLGTVQYMSPEQASGKSALIDPRTDVYSLGITLYELLTLQVPFADGDRQRILHRIVEDEPPGLRRIDPAIPLDLETIVLKAIAKSRDDRYATAQELADDLRRFLDGRPTMARRPTPIDRAAKWVKRHQKIVAFAVVLMAVSILGLTGATLAVLSAHAKTRAALSQSERNYRRAREVVDRFATGHAQQLANLPGAERLRQELLSDALAYYEGFIEQAGDDRGLLGERAATQFKIGSIADQTGDGDRALAAYREAMQAFQRLSDAPAEGAGHRRDLALCCNNVGLLLARKGDTSEAETAYRQAIGLLAELTEAPQDPAEADRCGNDLALCHGNLALLQGQTGRGAEAQASYRAAIEIQRLLVAAHPQEAKYAAALALSYNNLSYVLRSLDPAQAEQSCREAIGIQEKLAAEPSELAAPVQSNLALSYNNLGALESRRGRPESARTSYVKAIGLQRQLVRRAPAVVQYRRDLAISCNNLGRACSQVDDLRQAEASFREAQGILEDLVKDYPAELNYRSDLGGTLNNLARVEEQLGRTTEATRTCSHAIEHQRFALDNAPQVTRFREFLAQHYDNYARLLRAQRRTQEADVAAAARDKLRLGSAPTSESAKR